MNVEISGVTAEMCPQEMHTGLQDPGGDASPSGMQKGRDPLDSVHNEYRDTVGHSDPHEDPRLSRGMPVGLNGQADSVRRRVVDENMPPVDLPGVNRPWEAQAGGEHPPLPHRRRIGVLPKDGKISPILTRGPAGGPLAEPGEAPAPFGLDPKAQLRELRNLVDGGIGRLCAGWEG